MCSLTLQVNSAMPNHSGHCSCQWSMNIWRYYSNSWFILSVWLSICGWNTIDNFVSIPSMQFSSLIIPTANCGPLSEIILSGSPCNFQMLSLNNCANPFVLIFSVVGIKYAIFVNLFTTTKMELQPCAKGNFVMKSILIWVHTLLGIEFGINFPASGCIQFLFHQQALYLSTYCFTSLVTSGHQKFLVTNSAIFHCSPCPPTGVDEGGSKRNLRFG